MPNARVPAAGEAMPGEGHKSRRAALGLFAGLPALAILPAAAIAAAAEPDPVFAAIDRHRKAFDAFGEAAVRTDETAAKQEGREVTDADRAADDAASQAEKEAITYWLSVAPLTGAGMRASIEYALELDCGMSEETLGELVPALLRSPLLAARSWATETPDV